MVYSRKKMSFNSFSLLLVILPLSSLFTISLSTIPLGSTLFASNLTQSWSSPNNMFSLSFIPEPPSSFVAAISYAGGVPVWRLGGGTPVDSGGSLQFLRTGTLRLISGSGATVWDSNTENRNVSSASLEDSGNLVILQNDNVPVWSSFDNSNESDTLLPLQNFTFGNVLRSGSYSFTLRRPGNLTLRWNQSIIYWNQGLNSSIDSNLTSPVLRLEQTGILTIVDPSLSSPVIMAYSSDYAEGADILRFMRLDIDGNLRIYSSARGTGTKTVRWKAVNNQCEVFGYCGDMGICTYNDTGLDPVCVCPSPNFEFVNPNDSKRGCRRKVQIQDCVGNEQMLPLEHTEFLTFEPELTQQAFYVGISACSSNCISGSSCVASTSLSDGSGLCYLKTPGFISGYQSPVIPSTSYVKVCPPVLQNPSSSAGADLRNSKGWRLHAWVVAIVIFATLLVLVLVEGGLWFWCCRNSPKFGGLSAQYALLEYASGAPVQFSYKELQRATKGFKEKLGAGGFGAVYRGILVNKTVVAVKQLEGIEQGEKQFRMEVATISSTHHLNLVRLIGFCSEGKHRLLVYEFMKNSSLDNFLFAMEEHSGKLLNWEYRFNIALGTARGITYLHEECRDCIIHCDIKPENILLDENYTAKVSDFGLAKLVNPKDHRYRTLTSVRGTRGYLAPEWLANLPITSKSDIYSYGMVLLELVSGRRNFEVSPETNQKKFSLWAYEEFEKGNIEAIVDKRLSNQDLDIDQVMRTVQVSFWCIQEQPSQRPMMSKVLQMLEGIMEIDRPPPPKAVIEGSVSGNSINISSNFSALSTFATSAPAPSSSSSLQTGVSPLPSGRKIETASSSLLHSSDQL